jgi:hypothetical protein
MADVASTPDVREEGEVISGEQYYYVNTLFNKVSDILNLN